MAIKINNTTVIDDTRNFIPLSIQDTNSTVGTSGSILSSTGTAIRWIAPSTGGGGSGTFDTGITTSVGFAITAGGSTSDIFSGPSTVFTFPSTAGREYVIESIHIVGVGTDDAYLVGRHDYNGGSNVPIAQAVIVPYQGALELLEQPAIAGPSDVIRFQALTGVSTSAVGVNNRLTGWITYSTKTDTNYIGTGKTVTSSTGTEIYTSTTYPTVVQSIRLVNYNKNIDIDATVRVFRGGTPGSIVSTGTSIGNLVWNLTVPKNSTIEICEKPKYLWTNDTIVAIASTINSLAAHVSGKLVV